MHKKVAIVCNYKLNPNRIGGMDRFFVAFDKKLKSENYSVDWFFSDVIDFEFYQNLSVFSARNLDVGLFFLSKLPSDSYDIVITHFLPLCDSFSKKVKQQGVKKLIAVDHNPRPFEGFALSKIIKNKIKGLLYSRYTDQFIGVSDYTKKHILKDFGSFLNHKTAVVYNGIDCAIYKKRTETNFGKFIVTSHLRPSKGIQDLLKALSILPENILALMQVDIYGEGPMQEELMQITKDLQLQKCITFKGSSANLHNLFCDYSYMIQPTYMECFSLSILESLASDVPVITTSVGGNLEVITDGENGFVFAAGDIKNLAIILENIFSKMMYIKNDVSTKIKDHFNLHQMVENHFYYL